MNVPNYMKKIVIPAVAFVLGALLSVAPARTAKAEGTIDLKDKFVCRNYIGPNAVQSFVQYRDSGYKYKKNNIIDWKYDYGKTLRVGDDIYFSIYLDAEEMQSHYRKYYVERKNGAYGIYKYNIPSNKMTRISNKALIGMVYHDGFLYGIEAAPHANHIFKYDMDNTYYDQKGKKYLGKYGTGKSFALHPEDVYSSKNFSRINVENGKRQLLAQVEELFYKSVFDGTITFSCGNGLYTMNLDGKNKRFCGAWRKDVDYLGYTSNNRMIVEKGIGTPKDAFYELNVKTGKCKKIMDNTEKMNSCFVYEDHIVYAYGTSVKAYSLRKRKNSPIVAKLMKTPEYKVGNYQSKDGNIMYSQKQHTMEEYTFSMELKLMEKLQTFYLRKENGELMEIGTMNLQYCECGAD